MLVGAKAHADHVRSGSALAHGQGSDVLAADQLGKVFAPLGLGAVAENLVDAEIGVGTVGERHCG